jgi:hypothetical protein
MKQYCMTITSPTIKLANNIVAKHKEFDITQVCEGVIW